MQPNKRGRPRSDRVRKTVSLTVNPDAWQALQVLSISLGYGSRSELVDAIALGQLQILPIIKSP
jgi:hypothetical protein